MLEVCSKFQPTAATFDPCSNIRKSCCMKKKRCFHGKIAVTCQMLPKIQIKDIWEVYSYEQEQYFFTSYSYNKRMRALGALTGV